MNKPVFGEKEQRPARLRKIGRSAYSDEQQNPSSGSNSSSAFNIARCDGFLSALGPSSSAFGKVTIPNYDKSSEFLQQAYTIGLQAGYQFLARREAASQQADAMPWE